jgi:hypothetical protein
LFALVFVAGAALAACSGNFGAGTSAPGGLLPSGPLSGVSATATPTPSSAEAIVTYGDSTQFQPLPQAAGYGGAIAFETPSPRPSGFQAIPIGVTLTLVPPTDSPDLNLLTPGKKGKKRERPARPLVYVSLLATHDVSLNSYPRIAIDVPRDIVTTYRENELNLALYNAGTNDKAYRLSVAEHDTASPPPMPTPGKTAPPPPTPIPVSAGSAGPGSSSTPPPGFPGGTLPSPGGSPGAPGAPGAPGTSPSPAASPTLPPQRILFAGTAAALKLTANRPVVFALYALPIATPSPSPAPAAKGSSSPKPSGSGSPAAAGSPAAGGSPAASGSPVASGSPLPSGAPAASAAPAANGSASPAPTAAASANL